MSIEIVRREEHADGVSLLVWANHRQYKIHIRRVDDDNGTLAGYIPTIEPVQPIYGTAARAERAALQAIERISGDLPADHGQPVHEQDVSHATPG